MSEYEITLCGCDDQTDVLMDLTTSEVALLRKLMRRVNKAADYGCKPNMSIEKIKQHKT